MKSAQDSVCYEGGLELTGIGTKNVRGNEFNHILGQAMVRLENWYDTCQRGMTGYRRVWRPMCSELLDWV